jgi:hypothetical protein
MLPRTADYHFIYHPNAQKLQSRGTRLKSKDGCYRRVAMGQEGRPPAPQSCQHYTPRVLLHQQDTQNTKTEMERYPDSQTPTGFFFTSEEATKLCSRTEVQALPEYRQDSPYTCASLNRTHFRLTLSCLCTFGTIIQFP